MIYKDIYWDLDGPLSAYGKIEYSPEDTSEKNLILKNILQNFEGFDSSKNFNIYSISLKNKVAAAKNELIRDQYENIYQMQIAHFRDFVKTFYFIKTYTLAVEKLSIKLEVEKNSNQEKLVKDTIKFIELKHYIEVSKFYYLTMMFIESLKYRVGYFIEELYPEALYEIKNSFNEFLNNIFSQKIFPFLGYILLLIIFPLYFIIIPIDLFFTMRCFAEGVLTKKANNKNLLAAEKSIDENPYIGLDDLKSDLIACAEVNQTSFYNFVNKFEEYEEGVLKEKFTISKDFLNETTGQIEDEKYIKDKLDYRVLPKDPIHNIMSFVSGEAEANIIKKIMNNEQKDPKSGIKEIKQKRIKRVLLEKDNNKSSERSQ